MFMICMYGKIGGRIEMNVSACAAQFSAANVPADLSPPNSSPFLCRIFTAKFFTNFPADFLTASPMRSLPNCIHYMLHEYVRSNKKKFSLKKQRFHTFPTERKRGQVDPRAGRIPLTLLKL